MVRWKNYENLLCLGMNVDIGFDLSILPTMIIMMLMFCSPGWVEAGGEDDSKMVSEIEEAEDISGNSAFGPQTPSSPSTPLTISQSHKKS